MTVTIYHNPKCSTSRKVLDLLRERGLAPQVIDYLKTPPDRATLAALIARSGASVRSFLREKEAQAVELGLKDPALSDDAVLDAMIAHPILINRPIVATDKGVRLGRPVEAVEAIL